MGGRLKSTLTIAPHCEGALHQRAAEQFIHPRRLIDLQAAFEAIDREVGEEQRAAMVIVCREFEEYFGVRITELETL
jgi:hypothetical protein